jgi:hypothetical protein
MSLSTPLMAHNVTYVDTICGLLRSVRRANSTRSHVGFLRSALVAQHEHSIHIQHQHLPLLIKVLW